MRIFRVLAVVLCFVGMLSAKTFEVSVGTDWMTVNDADAQGITGYHATAKYNFGKSDTGVFKVGLGIASKGYKWNIYEGSSYGEVSALYLNIPIQYAYLTNYFGFYGVGGIDIACLLSASQKGKIIGFPLDKNPITNLLILV